ncbi:MAG: DNA-binding protein [Cyanobacteria bacterium P01_G01_bin.38]
MTSITIELRDNHFQALQNLANIHGIPVDVLLRSSLESWLSSQRSDFVDAADHVLTKNAELYKRLA